MNDLPTLNALEGITVDEDAAEQQIDITGIFAGGGEDQPLRVTAVSSNTQLIPNPAVTYTSPQNTGKLAFTPIPDQSGLAEITITVEDGGLDGKLETTADNATFTRTFTVTVRPANDAPTLNTLESLTVDEDAAEQQIDITGIFAGGGEDQPLRVTAVTSNTQLIPNPAVTYTSPQNTAKITLKPVPDLSGLADITITVEDGGLDGKLETTADNANFTRTFTVTVRPVNDQPTLDEIGSLTIDEDSTAVLSVTGITAGAQERQPLRLIVVSSDTLLLPHPEVTYSGGTAAQLRMRPAAASTGAARVTISVEDGGLDERLDTAADNQTFQRSLTVTVKPVRPRITAPSSVTLSQRPQISWTAVPGAASYDTWLRNTTANSNLPIRSITTATSWTPSADIGIGRIELWVRAIRADGTAMPWSLVYRFSVTTLAVVQPVERRQSTARPTVRWSSVPGATAYDVWVDNASTGQKQIVRRTTSDLQWTPDFDLPLARFQFWVRAIAAGGFAASWSLRTDFYVATAPLIISPMLPTFELRPEFRWGTVPGADSYGIFLRSISTGEVVASVVGLKEPTWKVGLCRFLCCRISQ